MNILILELYNHIQEFRPCRSHTNMKQALLALLFWIDSSTTTTEYYTRKHKHKSRIKVERYDHGNFMLKKTIMYMLYEKQAV